MATEVAVLLLALLLLMMTKTRKRKIASIELKPNTAKPAPVGPSNAPIRLVL